MHAPLSAETDSDAPGHLDAPLQIDRVVASDLRRAFETAEILARPWGLPVEPVAALRERHWGAFQGYTTAEVQARWPEAYQAWIADPLDGRPPGGESRREVGARVRPFIQQLAELPGETTVLVVGHAGSLSIGLCHLFKMPVLDNWQFRLDNTALTVVETFPEGVILTLFNDTSHLKGL
jgi:probable phosphoglycerate mutase